MYINILQNLSGKYQDGCRLSLIEICQQRLCNFHSLFQILYPNFQDILDTLFFVLRLSDKTVLVHFCLVEIYVIEYQLSYVLKDMELLCL